MSWHKKTLPFAVSLFVSIWAIDLSATNLPNANNRKLPQSEFHTARSTKNIQQKSKQKLTPNEIELIFPTIKESDKFDLKLFLKSNSQGGADAGGGNLTTWNSLFDFHENEKTKSIAILDLLKTHEVASALQALFDYYPVMARLLIVHANDKPWLFDKKPLSHAGCDNISTVQIKKNIAACQTSLEVRIQHGLWKKMKPAMQAALIIHELFVNQVLITYKRYYWPQYGDQAVFYKIQAEAFIREIIRQIFTETKFDHQLIENKMKNADMRFYIDKLLFKEKSVLLDKVYAQKSVHNPPQSFENLYADETAEQVLGPQNYFTYITSFSTKSDFEKYLQYLNKIVDANFIIDICHREQPTIQKLTAAIAFREASWHLLWDAKNLFGVSRFQEDFASLSGMPFLSILLSFYPQHTVLHQDFCKIYETTIFELAPTPFAPLPQEKIFEESKKVHQEQFRL